MITSATSGNWSAPATWTGGAVPTRTEPVTINHIVTVDVATAVSSTITVNATLKFAATGLSTLTMTGGNLTVNPGGTLNMGTAAAPIDAGTATLVLAQGNFAGQYGLIIQNSGVFTLRGRAKSTAGNALADALGGDTTVTLAPADVAGWAVGDEITIGQTEMIVFRNETEKVAITGIAGGVLSFSPSLVYNHLAASTVRVVNLTRNVVVRSSGTNTAADTSYLLNGTKIAANFSAAYGAFISLGANRSTNEGLGFNGAAGTISSSTVRDGYYGVFVYDSPGVELRSNAIYNNVRDGVSIGFNSSQIVADNDIYANRSDNLSLSGVSKVLISSNFLYSGSGDGVSLFNGSSLNTVTGNKVFCNSGVGIGMGGSALDSNNVFSLNDVSKNTFLSGEGFVVDQSSGTVLAGNAIWGNKTRGVRLGGTGALAAGAVLVGNNIYENQSNGLLVYAASNAVVADTRFGFDAAGTARPDAGEINFNPPDDHTLALKGCRVGGSIGVSNLSRAGSSLLSFGQDFTTGTVRVTGDYVLPSGGSLVLDQSQPLYASTATTPRLMRGTGHSGSVTSTNDSTAVSQLITVRYTGSVWQVEGSSSGVMGTCGGGSCNMGQFVMTFTPGGAPVAEDRVSFVLLASSRDAGVQKKLLFADGAASLNSGKSRLTVASGGSLSLRGAAGSPVLVDKLGTNAYTFLSQGSLTLSSASLSNMDVSGLQLSGSGAVQMSSVTFDNIASAGGAYINASTLTSNATFYNMAFNDTPNRTPFSARVLGTDSGMRWFMASFAGVRSGDSRDSDPNQRVLWADTAAPNAPGSFQSVSGATTGSIDLSWMAPLDQESSGPDATTLLKGGHFRIFRSTNAADIAGAIPSQAQIVLAATTTAAGTPWSYTDGSLALQSQSYKLWAVDELGNATSVTDSTTPARVTPGAAANFQAVLQGNTDILLTWNHPANPPAAYRGDYLLEFSAISPSGPWTAVPGTVLASTTSYLHQSLANNQVYYYQLTTRDIGLPPLSSSPAGPASATTPDTVSPLVVLEAAAGLGTRSVGISWSAAPALTFSKPMNTGAAAGASALRRLVDNLGQPIAPGSQDVPVNPSWDPSGTVLTLTPASPLSGNTVYELSVTTAAMDTFGKVLSSSATLRFVTSLDRSVRNIVTEGTMGVAVEIQPMALAQDGYLTGQALPGSQMAAATRKLSENAGDPLRRPIPGTIVDLDVFDASGGAQPTVFASPVTVSLPIPYADSNADGVLDGTSPPVRVRSLAIYWLDAAHDLWVPLPSSVDAAAWTVSARTPHFTTFALMAQADLELSGAHPFPVPYTPGQAAGVCDGVAAEICFTGLPQTATVRVYTPDGRLVRELSSSDGSGQLPWDARNSDGEAVATGVYLYEISNGHSSVTGKLAVLR